MIAPIKYPIGIQSFESLREGGYAYVDKTGYFPLLLQGKYYFLSRPRRFGKSLLLSTLEAYFRGRKDLFKDLAISETEKDWIEYPVVHVDFNTCQERDITKLEQEIRDMLSDIAHSYEIDHLLEGSSQTIKDAGLGYMFSRLVKLLYEKCGREVVILIDEYDKGLLETIQDDTLLDDSTARLRPFFNVLKSCDRYIRFAFVTGVSRFRNTTLFSGANNLQDISLDNRFASLLGISHEELTRYFSPGVEAIAANNDWSIDVALKVLRNKYDGYRFTEMEEYLYNPFSLLNALNTTQLRNYWVATGSSRVLASFLKKSNFNLEEMTRMWVSAEDLESTFSLENPMSLFFQTGYLTVAEARYDNFRLKIPNQEVQSAFNKLIIPEFVEGLTNGTLSEYQMKLKTAISKGEVEGIMQMLQAILGSIPYHDIDTAKPLEKHLHLCMYLIFMMLGVDTKCEIAQSAGRVDMVAQTPWRVYVFEFKIDKNPEEALRQIDDKDYALPWTASGRKVIKIGVQFSSSSRNIKDFAYIAENC